MEKKPGNREGSDKFLSLQAGLSSYGSLASMLVSYLTSLHHVRESFQSSRSRCGSAPG